MRKIQVDKNRPIYSRFIGVWVLDTEACVYEQGDPPQSGTYKIIEQQQELVFRMQWVDADGETHDMSFRGKPDGVPVPFNGGDLADALAITAASEDRLNSSAFLKGRELMVATRTLSADGAAMHITQSVRLPDGTEPTNRSTYRRLQ